MTANYVNLATTQTFKFHEGWLDHRTQDGHWVRYWCVLKKDDIFLFSSNKTSKDALVGTIALGSQSRIEKKEGDERIGYKFDLFSLKRVNTFKAAKFSERELWKAYVEGIAMGCVPDNIDLLPGQINDIQITLNEFKNHQISFPRPESVHSSTSSFSSKDCFDTPNTSTSGSHLDFDSDNNYLEPVFYSDLARTDIPSWFFPNCSRDQAILILDNGSKYGNTLMREGTHDSKNLVISKKIMENLGKKSYLHFVVTQHSSGYRIDVENPHQPMKSLSEIMEFFVESSGRASTFPMKTNDLSKFGINEQVYNDYNTKIVKFQHDADSGEETVEGPQFSKNSDIVPPEPPAPPPPPAHSQKSLGNRNSGSTQDHLVAGPQSYKNSRSKSVPNISPEDLERLQMSNREQVRSITKQSSQTHSVVNPSPLPNHPASVPPPLPPNHPPPLKHSASLDTACKTKGVGPRTFHSMGSADGQVHKLQAALKYSVSVCDKNNVMKKGLDVASKSSSENTNEKANLSSDVPVSKASMKPSSITIAENSLRDDMDIIYSKVQEDLPMIWIQNNESDLISTEYSPNKILVATILNDNEAESCAGASGESIHHQEFEENTYELVDASPTDVSVSGTSLFSDYSVHISRTSDLYESVENVNFNSLNIFKNEESQQSRQYKDGPEEPNNEIKRSLELHPTVKVCSNSEQSKFPTKNSKLNYFEKYLFQNEASKIGNNFSEVEPAIDSQAMNANGQVEMGLKKKVTLRKLIEENEDYEVIQNQTSEIIHCVSNPEQTYESIFWMPVQKNSELKLNDKISENVSVLKRASTIATCSRPTSQYSINGTYSEVAEFVTNCLNVKPSNTYVDIIANYEDIKAARAARGSFSGPSKDQCFTPSIQRSQSEMCKNNSLEENFKKKLEGLLGSTAISGSVANLAPTTYKPQIPPPRNGSENFEMFNHYQNAQEIRNRSNMQK